MEFTAYPTTVPSGRKEVRTLLKLQNTLHSTDSIVLPVSMLLLGSSMVAYQHCTHWDTSRTSVRNFLIKILVSMIPLAILEMKVPKCADPVGLFSRFSSKVMLMHVGFLAIRWSSTLFDARMEAYYFNTTMLVLACVLMPTVFGCRPTLTWFKEHADAFLLIALGIAVAIVEVETFSYTKFHSHFFRSRYMEDVITSASDYIEIIAFVPAVWMAYRKSADAIEQDVEAVSRSQRRALCLFAFMIIFYSQEDISNALSVWSDFKIATFAHLTHYVLLLDFAGFLLAHLCDPEKLQSMKSSFMNWVTESCVV